MQPLLHPMRSSFVLIFLSIVLAGTACQSGLNSYSTPENTADFDRQRWDSPSYTLIRHNSNTILETSLKTSHEAIAKPIYAPEALAKNRVHPEILRAAAIAFVRAYPEQLEKYELNALVFKDGTRMYFNPKISSGHFHALMSRGRLRLEDFFRKMYGNTKSEAQNNLKVITWLPKSRNLRVSFNGVNGAAAALKKVSNALDTLPQFHKYLAPCSGTFIWRQISGSKRLSNHSFGIAIDINSKYGDYWRWAPEFKKGEPLKFRNRIPMEIVAIFEQNGFVWGGRWPHYDTMHFEYHPEVKLYNTWFNRSRFSKK